MPTKIRPQNNLHHIVSVIRIADWITLVLEEYMEFSIAMVLSAFIRHEDGEAITKNDTEYGDKKNDASDDVNEYKWFIIKTAENIIEIFH